MKAVLPLLVLLGVAACGRDPASTGPAASSRATPAKSDDTSVAAVSTSTGKPAISLRFAMDSRPTAGVASAVRLELAGDPGSVTLRLQGDGLQIEPATAALTLPEGGASASLTVQVTPRAAGLSEIQVRIQPQGEGAQEIDYAVPMMTEPAK